jgi:hypothetical protein
VLEANKRLCEITWLSKGFLHGMKIAVDYESLGREIPLSSGMQHRKSSSSTKRRSKLA